MFFKSLSLVLGAVIFCALTASAQDKFDFRTHPYFKHLIGEWKLEAEVTRANGDREKFTQLSKTEVAEANVLTTEGAYEGRDLSVRFKWMFTHTASGKLEAVLQPDLDKPDLQRFEVKVSEDCLSLEITRALKNQQKMTVVDAFKDGDYDLRELTRTITDSEGAVLSTTTALSKRVKKP